MMRLVVIVVLLFIGADVFARSSPMERLLKKQIMEKRLKDERAYVKPPIVVKVKKKRSLSVQRPPHQIVLVAGLKKKLWADIVLPSKRDEILRIRHGDRLDYLGSAYRVEDISDKGVVLSHGKRRWHLSFISFRVERGTKP